MRNKLFCKDNIMCMDCLLLMINTRKYNINNDDRNKEKRKNKVRQHRKIIQYDRTYCTLLVCVVKILDSVSDFYANIII